MIPVFSGMKIEGGAEGDPKAGSERGRWALQSEGYMELVKITRGNSEVDASSVTISLTYLFVP